MKFLSIFFILTLLGFVTNKHNVKNTSQEYGCSLQLIGLECVSSDGFITPDAIYFDIGYGNDVEEWPRSRIKMKQGDYYDLRKVDAIFIDQKITFTMWDDNIWDADDLLGAESISCIDKGSGNKYITFAKDGAHYNLYYRID